MFKRNTLEIVLVLLLISVVSISCKDKKLYPDVDHIQIDLKVVPFYLEINKVDTLNVISSIQLLQEKYGKFLQAYNQKIIRLGKVEDQDYPQRLNSFINYQANKDIIQKAKEVFPNHNAFIHDLERGFKYYKYYFPDAKIPDIYLMISGFSQSIAVDNDWVGVSIEKYLGSDCEFYEWLNIAKYLRKGMTKEKMAPDVLRAMALTNYHYNDQVDDLINHMVYKGKIRYFIHRMFPELQDTLLFDYSAAQMDWCTTNEANMWASMVEWKHVFSNDRMLIRKYTEDAPFTANFGNNSAPRGGEFLGYKIVEAYMNKNDQVTLKELMEESDGRKILAASNYRP